MRKDFVNKAVMALNGKLDQARRLARTPQIGYTESTTILLPAAVALLSDRANDSERDAIARFGNQSPYQGDRDVLYDILDREQFHPADRRVVEAALRRVSYMSDPGPEPPEDPELAGQIAEAAAAKEVLRQRAEKLLDARVLAERDVRREMSQAPAGASPTPRSQAKLRAAAHAYTAAATALQAAHDALAELQSEREARRFAWYLNQK